MANAQRNPIDTLRCTESMLRAVIDELDKQELFETGPDGKRRPRRHRRIPFPSVTPVLLDVNRPGEGSVGFLVAPRDISSGGMSLLAGMFMHPGTSCAVTLRAINGEFIRIGGMIKRCRFVALRLHEVGIQFASGVDVARFIVKPEDADARWAIGGANVYARMAVKTGELMEALRNSADKATIEELIREIFIQCRDWAA